MKLSNYVREILLCEICNNSEEMLHERQQMSEIILKIILIYLLAQYHGNCLWSDEDNTLVKLGYTQILHTHIKLIITKQMKALKLINK